LQPPHHSQHHPSTRFRPRSSRAFSLVEVLLVLAFIAMIGGLIVTNTDALMRGLGPPPLPRTLTMAVREARYQAAAEKQPMRLSFDHDAGAFLVTSEAGEQRASIESGYGADNPRVSVTFYKLIFQRGADADVFSSERERIEVDSVRFLPDRSSTPFEVELEAEGERSTHRYDTFSDIELKSRR